MVVVPTGVVVVSTGVVVVVVVVVVGAECERKCFGRVLIITIKIKKKKAFRF